MYIIYRDPLIVFIIYKYYRIKIIPKLLFCLMILNIITTVILLVERINKNIYLFFVLLKNYF